MSDFCNGDESTSTEELSYTASSTFSSTKTCCLQSCDIQYEVCVFEWILSTNKLIILDGDYCSLGSNTLDLNDQVIVAIDSQLKVVIWQSFNAEQILYNP